MRNLVKSAHHLPASNIKILHPWVLHDEEFSVWFHSGKLPPGGRSTTLCKTRTFRTGHFRRSGSSACLIIPFMPICEVPGSPVAFVAVARGACCLDGVRRPPASSILRTITTAVIRSETRFISVVIIRENWSHMEHSGHVPSAAGQLGAERGRVGDGQLAGEGAADVGGGPAVHKPPAGQQRDRASVLSPRASTAPGGAASIAVRYSSRVGPLPARPTKPAGRPSDVGQGHEALGHAGVVLQHARARPAPGPIGPGASLLRGVP